VALKQRDDQKLWLILFQLKGIRARLNSLAGQYFAFSALAIIIVGAAVVLAAAAVMPPLGFLSTAVLVALAAFVGVVRVTRTALRSSASPIKAASLADDRGSLKGRLTSVLLLSEAARKSELWRYLVEDTYGRRREFEPSKIEPRWFSRSFFALLGASLGSLILLRIVRLQVGSHSFSMSGLPSQVTANLSNLDIRPADPALQPNAEIYADEATLRKLADKIASAHGNEADKDALSRWLNRARELAGGLQNKITGKQHRPPVELHLTDKDSQAPPPSHQAPGGGSNGANQSQVGKSGKPGEAAPPRGNAPGDLAQNGTGIPGQLGSDSGQASPNDLGPASPGATGNGDGLSHGSGSDPEHLFGPPSSQPLGSDSFKITIDAQPSDESSTPGAPAYIPPKVRVPLNDQQHDDEPMARASVPAADQMTIKRVFER
jgi:hypothetical protein